MASADCAIHFDVDVFANGVSEAERNAMRYYSQMGEDRWLVENLSLPLHGVCVEVGVGRWREYSNSLHFEERGWDCILVEPNPDLHAEIRLRRLGQLFPVAAGNQGGSVAFTCENEPTVSGILRNPTGNGCRRIEVPITTLTEILTEADVTHVDVLSIDTEGTELDVWAGLDLSRWKPRVVIVEWSTIGLPEDPMKIIRRLLADGYALVHVTDGNLIFTRR